MFSRTSSVPYFVVFSTTPRSHTLSLEIASDATIAVSVLRQITVLESITFPPTPPLTPSASSEESDPPPSAISRFKRVVKSPSQTLISRGFVNPEEGFELREKPLPRLPGTTVYSDSCNLHTAMCIGFPKRPRLQCDDQGHPSLDVHAALPDGLHKSKILLNRDMLPSIDWAGLSVKVCVCLGLFCSLLTFSSVLPRCLSPGRAPRPAGSDTDPSDLELVLLL